MGKEYVFTQEVKRWGVETGDIYSPSYHQIIGGTEKLLSDGIIKEETMEQEKPQTIFTEGIYLNKVHEKAPAFIVANVSIHLAKAIAWMQANKHLADEKGYIRLTGKESREGKRYFQVDTWKPERKQENNDIPFD